jgi:hypothetical protein
MKLKYFSPKSRAILLYFSYSFFNFYIFISSFYKYFVIYLYMYLDHCD